MKNIKGFTLGLVLGLSIAVAGIAYAQTNTQSDQNKKAECCCVAMDCCSGESCAMMKKDGAKNHATSADKEGGCCGDSCNMKDRAKTTTATANAASDKHGCCSGGDSCDMNHTKHKDGKSKP